MIVEIIPNWHPIFVHFTVALFSTATGLFVLGTVAGKKEWSKTVLTAAHINLWLGALATIATIAAGLYAYNTVNHDAPSHLAMTDHRNWAFGTAALFALITLWSFKTFAYLFRFGSAMTTINVIVDETHRLHECINSCRTNKRPSTLFKVFGNGCRLR